MFPKPPKGSANKARRSRKRKNSAIITEAKEAARQRDGHRCRRCGRHGVEAAHIVDAGMGGRFDVSNTPACYVSLCPDCHRGTRSVHSGHLVIVAGPDGGDGSVTFEPGNL